MTQRSIAFIVDRNDNRYRLKSWRSGSRSTSTPARAAKLYEKGDSGWDFLDEWDVSIDHGGGHHTPKSDTDVLTTAISRIETIHGVDIAEVILDTENGWGHDASTDPDVIDNISTSTI